MSRLAVTMDAKQAGNVVFLVGATKLELGGSHLSLVRGLTGGRCAHCRLDQAKQTFAKIHRSDPRSADASLPRLERRGLGGRGGRNGDGRRPGNEDRYRARSGRATVPDGSLFSESNTRFLVEVGGESAEMFEQLLRNGGCAGLPSRYNRVVGQLLVTCGDAGRHGGRCCRSQSGMAETARLVRDRQLRVACESIV